VTHYHGLPLSSLANAAKVLAGRHVALHGLRLAIEAAVAELGSGGPAVTMEDLGRDPRARDG
jgi:hypothetical protein